MDRGARFVETMWCVGLSLERATDVTTLSSESEKVERQLRELTVASRTRYAPRQHRDELRCELASCAARRDDAQADVDRLRRQEATLRCVVEAAKTYVCSVQPPCQTVGDVVLDTLASMSSLSPTLSCRVYVTCNCSGLRTHISAVEFFS